MLLGKLGIDCMPIDAVFRNGLVHPNFWKGKSVFLTGHTGFKGGWLSIWLASMGAKVTGYALAPNTVTNFFEASRLYNRNNIL